MPPNIPKIIRTKKGLQETAIDEMGDVVEMADIVAFVLEARAMLVSEPSQNGFDVAKRVAEDEVVGRAQIGLFPVELPLFVAVC